MTRTRATAIGFSAVLMWGMMPILTIGTAPVPPLLMTALCFGISGLLGLAWAARRGLGRLLSISWRVHAFGVAGLFGYHFFYFNALRAAPAAETVLFANFWPLLIVLFSGLLPGERLRLQHVAGALIALAGAALIILNGGAGGAFTVTGLLYASGCSLTWALYSVISRRLGDVPSDAVAIYCIGTAVLSALAHLVLEDTLWPGGTVAWLSLVALALGPIGAAFFTWDIGMKKGNIQLLGVASYAGPPIAVLTLVAAGVNAPTWSLLVAVALIVAGAMLAASPGLSPPASDARSLP